MRGPIAPATKGHLVASAGTSWLPAAALALGLGGASLALAQGGGAEDISARAYAQNCAVCHGAEFAGGQFGPALVGAGFMAKWAGRTAGALYDLIHATMPPDRAGGLPATTYAAFVDLILRRNGVLAADAPRLNARSDMALVTFPASAASAAAELDELGVGGVSTRFPPPQWPQGKDRFAGYKPLIPAMLADPAPENWLTWRRSHRGLGYSPLAAIDKANVKNLRIAWSQALPPGTNMNEPLVRDGVLYVFGFGDEVFAMDAANGSVLWRYRRELPQGTRPDSRKTIALYGDKLFIATSDLHVAALDARTGKPVWDTPITDKPGFRNPGGPLVADGVVIQGLTTQAAGGGLIAGFDAESGKHLWTFNTVAPPGDPGGNSWNGLPAEARSGGSVWTSGTYDPESGVALFGTGPTYDTGPLAVRRPGQNNDALYTDTTLALEPRTGKLRWYFQHMKNDQWDLDWVFDRVVGTLDVDGEPRRVIMTSGKEGLFDTLDAATGRYIKTVDMGLQDFVTAIDPRTGEKTIDPAKLPSRDRTIFICPHGGGGRNWGPTSFNPASKSLFVVARDVCMDMKPAKGRGFLSTGVNIDYAARPGSDGRYGMLQALDMQNGKVRWDVRQRAPFNTGVLTTAGGILFAGSVDRQFAAWDQATGAELWRTGLSGIPNGSPISFSVDGKQYIAVVTGHGNPLSFGLGRMTPEIALPPVNSSAIYVFALPD